MKIVYCLIDSSSPGGMERSICTKANYLADVLGYNITIVTTDRRNRDNFFEYSSKIHFIDLDINYIELANESQFKGILSQIRKRRLHKKRLSKLLNDLKPDICISTCTHEFTILPTISDGSRKVAEFHFCRPYKEIEYSLLPVSSLVRKKALWAEKNKYRYINKYDAFVVLTEEDALRWQEFANIEVIPNVLSFYPKEQSDCTSKRVLSIGRLSPQKAFHYLIDAWQIVHKAHADWVLDIYGSGSEYDKLKRKISDQNLSDSISIHSPKQNIEAIYNQASIYVMSSVYEGFGLVLAEAMLCGLPCVTFNCPSGPSEIVSDEVNGYLVPVGDAKVMADRIIELIDDNDLRQKMGKQAHYDAERFLAENIMPRWITLFDKVTNNANLSIGKVNDEGKHLKI